ncbi:MAG: uncharacterized protein KVP18_000824 [Porospora cf. gigantea A]|uniref:uncharacterized protein n=1 Tax=Porospora cf. gigantea A TaxID=2853593 RepID=UPI003559E4E7|nr:MAG: hypothetical protein KVP18_000824 [Porospora cf. gigantea A]
MKTCLLALLGSGTAFYLPGSTANTYEVGAPIPVTSGKLMSHKTQIPYSYYHFDFCRPDVLTRERLNLGQILEGDVVENTPYELLMNQDQDCKVSCRKEYNKEALETLKQLIDERYFVTLNVDDLPVALQLELSHMDAQEGAVTIGYPLGLPPLMGSDKYTIMNHLDFIVKYHSTDRGNRVVGAEVIPRSIAHSDVSNPCAQRKDDHGPLFLSAAVPASGMGVYFTYSVRFEVSDVAWATRWDPYFRLSNEEAAIHWYAVVDGLIVVLLLGVSGIIILMRTVLKDIARYNTLYDIEAEDEETGWKLVHGDVFRRPLFSRFLAALAGSGVQLLIMIALVTFFSLLGIISPVHRGGLLESSLLLFALLGGPAGFVAARFNKTMGTDELYAGRSLAVTVFTALLYPGVIFSVFFLLNFVLWNEGSSGSVPFGTMFILLFLWFGVSTPLTIAGAYYGYRQEPFTVPVRVNKLPREVKSVPVLYNPNLFAFGAGIIPISVAIGELSSIANSLIYHNFYYLFGFLTLIILLTVSAAALVSTITTYSSLVQENYHWWWRSFISGASAGIYLFIFALVQFLSIEIVRFASVIIYFGYAFILCFTVAVVLGSIGFMSSFLFVKTIYGSIKVE